MEADVEAAIEVLYPIPFAFGVIFLVLFALARWWRPTRSSR